jgi:lysyl-tRNA synthetase class 2
MSYALAASLATLRQRAAMLAAIRAFFAARGVLEVETPALSRAGVTDPAIESITATVRSLGTVPLYLHTSPEFAMKRLLAAGSGDLYQLCRVFRDGELGRWHEPEFTLLEWYRIGFNDERLMTEVAELIDAALGAVAGNHGAAPRRAVRVRYTDALQRALGARPEAATAELAAELGRRGIDVPQGPGLAHDAVLDLAFATVVVASFDPAALTFVHDYPVSQAALARLKATTPPVAARFEVFGGGVELANGFHELEDPVEQRRRFEAERAERVRAGRHAPPLDEELLAALTAGLPDCAGVALGVDRLVALALGHDNVASTMAFTHAT